MNRDKLNLSMEVKQSLYGRMLLSTRLLVFLVKMNLLAYEDAMIYYASTYKYRTGKGKWKRVTLCKPLNNEIHTLS